MTIEEDVATLKAQQQFMLDQIKRHDDELAEGREVFADIRDHLASIATQAARADEREKNVDSKLTMILDIDRRVRTIEQRMPGLVEVRRWIIYAVLGVIGIVGATVLALAVER